MMRTRCLQLEALESRCMLDGSGLIDNGPARLDDPFDDDVQAVLAADEAVYTTFELDDGQTVLLSVGPDHPLDDLVNARLLLHLL